ncbi:MAG: PilZ domain-containing protein [Sphingomonas sp.]|jgi:hypothetical protein
MVTFLTLDEERRRARRRPVRMNAHLRQTGETNIEVMVGDLSTGGARLDMIYRLRVASVVWLHIDSFEPFRATVKWINDRVAGIELDRPLHPAVLDHIVSHHSRR